ncbi:MAG TPA: hypothetical protein DEP48_03205 [Persephonella sp.]|uniref:Uncharacterized protein n=1 Tax=Persephonella marina (strain DSM 14350 / EX-H1) TaxID=123214 RepID=C0QSF2_PERMH|nr:MULTISPECIES: hypothetical protein [Persephonella]ACO02995.1 hypothetical protein PERMA_1836 [Persephonella marina EX-H1]HCB69346.1 hypothetical protein [Persephonella sp.]
MRFDQKTVGIVLTVLVVFVVGGLMVERTVEFLNSDFSNNETDFRGFLIQIFAHILTIIGWLFIIIAAFLKGHFNDIEKPKTDILELEEKIRKKEIMDRKGG